VSGPGESRPPPAGRFDGAWTLRLLPVLAAVLLALLARWGWASPQEGPRFFPRPDALEYAASAQAIAQTGQIFLQIGPYRVRPRYPPGWPMLLAVAVRLGWPGDQLWRVAGIFGAALAGALALLARRAVQALAPGAAGSAAVAALIAGCGWAVAPLAMAQGQVVMSDEPAAFAAVACLALTGAAWLGAGAGRAGLAIAAAGGLACGLAAGIRPVIAALLVAPLALLLAGGLRRAGLRALLPRLASWSAGAALFPALTMILLARSAIPPLEWSGYRFWVPERFATFADTFQLRYALHGNQAMPLGSNGEAIPHLAIAALVLGGLPKLPAHQVLGLFWPLAGWLAAPWLLRACRHRGGAAARIGPWVAAALLAWTVGYVVVFSLYFFPAPRFYLGAAALCLTLFATACGLALAQPRAGVRRLAAAGVLLCAALFALAAADYRREPPVIPGDEDPRPAVARWLGQRDAQRAKRVMPFDPVYAQALGLLSPRAVADVESWGRLPNTVHVRRLRNLGYFDRQP
jgi:hypothetical protein